MSAEEHRQHQKALLNQQYELLKECNQKIIVETGVLEKAKLENEKQAIEKNIVKLENELFGLPRVMAEGYFRYNHINLDMLSPAIIGRDTEMTELDRLLTQNGCAAITGVGGQGKSSLAYAYLVQSSKFKVQSSASLIQNSKFKIQNSFDAAVWLYIRGDGTDLDTLVRLLGLEAARLPEDTSELVRQHLATHPTLVVLDNFEAAMQEGGRLPLDVEPLLTKLSRLQGASRVIITSREIPKNFPARQVLRLGGLTQTAGADLLFELGLDSEPRAMLEEATRKAGGNPFALTLLAGLVTDSFTGDTLETLLREGDLWDKELASEERLLPRTWNTRLNEAERHLLQILAILRPPARYASLLALAQLDDLTCRELLKQLGAKSLLTTEADPADPKKIRGYDLHPLFRRFILNQKLTQDEQTALHQTATAYFQALIPTLPSKANYERKILEHAWCVLEAVHHLNEQGDFEAAKDLFFEENLHEDLSRLGQAVLRVEIFSNWAKVTTWRYSSTKGVILGNLGLAYSNLGKVEEAIVYHHQALAIAREIGDRRGEGARLGNLGLAYSNLGKVEEAIVYHHQALAIAREIGDRRGEGNRLGNLGLAYSNLGKVEEAIVYYHQALAIAREIGDRRGEGNRLGNLGLAYSDLGKVEEAIAYYQQALAISREIGDRRGEGADLGNLGIAYKNLGKVEEAIIYYQQALTITKEISDRRGEGNHLANLGLVYEQQEQLSRALAHWRRAVEIYRDIKAPTAERVQGWIDELQKNGGDEEFARLLSESEPIYQGLRKGEIS